MNAERKNKTFFWAFSAFSATSAFTILAELLLTCFRRKSKIEIIKPPMSFNKESAVERAKSDLAKRLKIGVGEIKEKGIADKDFPDMSLGAPEKGEMSAQMIASGWQIKLGANGKSYEYRTDKYQLRLVGFKGANYVVG